MAFARSCVTQSFENDHIYRAFYGSQLLGGRTGSKGSRYKDQENFLKSSHAPEVLLSQGGGEVSHFV